MDDKKEEGFVVKDRRKVTLDDLDQPTETPTAQEPETDAPKAEPETAESRTEHEAKQRRESERSPLPAVTFSTFVFSLSSSVLVHLGEVPDPATNLTRTDLPLAKQIIDTLGMLDEKTKGNLDPDEHKLLKSVLYDLRMRYIQKSSS